MFHISWHIQWLCCGNRNWCIESMCFRRCVTDTAANGHSWQRKGFVWVLKCTFHVADFSHTLRSARNENFPGGPKITSTEWTLNPFWKCLVAGKMRESSKCFLTNCRSNNYYCLVSTKVLQNIERGLKCNIKTYGQWVLWVPVPIDSHMK